jgi:hypothetical protein
MWGDVDGLVASIPNESEREERSDFAARLVNSPLSLCFQFWRESRVDGRVPLKSTIDPVRMPRRILPFLFIYEMIGGRFRCRLAGTEIAAAFQRDPTGKFLDELALPPDGLANRTRLFTEVVTTGVPVIYGGHLSEGLNTWMRFQRLLLPISRTGAATDILFGMVIFPQIDINRSWRGAKLNPQYNFEVWATPVDLI